MSEIHSGSFALARPAAAAPVIVLMILALTLLSAIAFVATYGANVPFGEDWEVMAPVLAGKQAISLQWLWSQSNEHRVPLPKLLLLGLSKLANSDFRAGMFFNVLALGAVSLAMIRAASQIRGRISYCDCFFPLVFLHWGHFENLLWSWQLQFVSSAALCSVLLAVIARANRLATGSALLGGICLLLLPLCGANGLAVVPALAVWGVYEAFVIPRSRPHSIGPRYAMMAAGLASLMLVGLYFVGYQAPAGHPASADFATSLMTAVIAFSMALGASFRTYWMPRSLLMAALLLPSAILLLRNWRERDERPRIVGLLLFLASLFCLALAIGWGRSGLGFEAATAARYVTLMVPALCWVYFVWEIYGRRAGRWVQAMLFSLAIAMFCFNIQDGREFAIYRREATRLFEEDVHAGVPPFVLAEHFSGHPYHLYPTKEQFADRMRMLHEAGIGLFRELQPDPVYEEIELAPNSVSDAQERRVVQLGQARKVYAIRLRFAPPGAAPTALEIFWRNSGRTGAPGGAGSSRSLSRPQERDTAIIWVNDVIDQFRVFHNRPSARVTQVTLIVAQ
jgi:hypothetical protein